MKELNEILQNPQMQEKIIAFHQKLLTGKQLNEIDIQEIKVPNPPQEEKTFTLFRYPGTDKRVPEIMISQPLAEGGFGAVWEAAPLILEKGVYTTSNNEQDLLAVKVQYVDDEAAQAAGKNIALLKDIREEAEKLRQKNKDTPGFENTVVVESSNGGDTDIVVTITKRVPGNPIGKPHKTEDRFILNPEIEKLPFLEKFSLGILLLETFIKISYDTQQFGSSMAHTDVKPENFIYDHIKKRFVTLDFGLAKELGLNQSTIPSTAEGTLLTMAPEMVEARTQGTVHISEKADVHALAGIIIAMLNKKDSEHYKYKFEAEKNLDVEGFVKNSPNEAIQMLTGMYKDVLTFVKTEPDNAVDMIMEQVTSFTESEAQEFVQNHPETVANLIKQKYEDEVKICATDLVQNSPDEAAKILKPMESIIRDQAIINIIKAPYFIDLDVPDELNSNLFFPLSELNKEEIEILIRLLEPQTGPAFDKIKEINFNNAVYKNIAFTRAEIDVIKQALSAIDKTKLNTYRVKNLDLAQKFKPVSLSERLTQILNDMQHPDPSKRSELLPALKNLNDVLNTCYKYNLQQTALLAEVKKPSKNESHSQETKPKVSPSSIKRVFSKFFGKNSKLDNNTEKPKKENSTAPDLHYDFAISEPNHKHTTNIYQKLSYIKKDNDPNFAKISKKLPKDRRRFENNPKFYWERLVKAATKQLEKKGKRLFFFSPKPLDANLENFCKNIIQLNNNKSINFNPVQALDKALGDWMIAKSAPKLDKTHAPSHPIVPTVSVK